MQISLVTIFMASSFQLLHNHTLPLHPIILSPTQTPQIYYSSHLTPNPLHTQMHLKLDTSSRGVRISKSMLRDNHQRGQVPDRETEKIRDWKARTGLVKPEPPNFEIGWKRTKHIPLEKPKGYVVMDFLQKLVELMDKIVAERAIEEAEVLRDEGKVEDRMLTELSRVLKLMEMDLAMVKAAVKEETLNERLKQAKARCRQAILVAN